MSDDSLPNEDQATAAAVLAGGVIASGTIRLGTLAGADAAKGADPPDGSVGRSGDMSDDVRADALLPGDGPLPDTKDALAPGADPPDGAVGRSVDMNDDDSADALLSGGGPPPDAKGALAPGPDVTAGTPRELEAAGAGVAPIPHRETRAGRAARLLLSPGLVDRFMAAADAVDRAGRVSAAAAVGAVTAGATTAAAVAVADETAAAHMAGDGLAPPLASDALGRLTTEAFTHRPPAADEVAHGAARAAAAAAARAAEDDLELEQFMADDYLRYPPSP